MKTRQAILWATLSIVNTLAGLQVDGFMQYVIAIAVAYSLYMLWSISRDRKHKVTCVRCDREIRVSESGVTTCPCGVKHTWHD